MRSIHPIWCLTLTLLLCLLNTSPAYSLEIAQDQYGLSGHFEYLIDEGAQLSLADITQDKHQQAFISSSTEKPSTSNHQAPIWLKLTLEFSPQASKNNFILSTPIGNYSEIRIYRPSITGVYQESITGNAYPAKTREVKSPKYSFEIDSSLRKQIVYLRIIGGLTTHSLPWVLLGKNTFDQKNNMFSGLVLLSLGALLGILAFSAGIGFTLRNNNYLFYSLYILAGTLSLMHRDGFGFTILWPNQPEFNLIASDILIISISATRLLTILTIFNIKHISLRLYRTGIAWLIILAILFFVACTSGLQTVSPYFSGIIWLISLLFGLFISIYAVRQKVHLAVPFFLVLLIPLIGSLIQGFVETGFLDISVFSLQYAKMAFLLHSILFSICIALQIKHEVNAKIIAQHDALTGLPSLLLARDRFSKAAASARRHNWKLAILFVDLDGFKPINDTYGHETGDKLLIEVSERISSCLRDADTVARVGGDEFIIIQTEVKGGEASTKVAKKIVAALTLPFIIDNSEIKIGASIGIAQFPDHGQDFNELMKAADQAMYKVKKAGKNNYILYQAA